MELPQLRSVEFTGDGTLHSLSLTFYFLARSGDCQLIFAQRKSISCLFVFIDNCWTDCKGCGAAQLDTLKLAHSKRCASLRARIVCAISITLNYTKIEKVGERRVRESKTYWSTCSVARSGATVSKAKFLGGP